MRLNKIRHFPVDSSNSSFFHYPEWGQPAGHPSSHVAIAKIRSHLFHLLEIETANNFDNLNSSVSENVVNSPNSDFTPT